MSLVHISFAVSGTVKAYIFISLYDFCGGPGSVVGIATAYGLDGPGSNPGGGRDFPALKPTQPPVKWVAGLSRG